MYRMILLIGVALSFHASSSFAEGPNADADFGKHKTEASARIDQRIAELNNLKSCINSAANKDAIKSCHEKHKDSAQNMRAEHLQDRMERLEKKKAELQQKMQQAKQPQTHK